MKLKNNRQKGASEFVSRLMMDELIYGKSIYHSSKDGLRIVDPLSREAEKVLFDIDVKKMTVEEIKNKYGDVLTKEQLKQLGI